MRLLADENIDAPIVHWLRSQGHDVAWIAEQRAGATDQFILDEARKENRMFLTRDRDFGELVFRLGQKAAGIGLIRLPGRTVEVRLSLFQTAWPEIELKLQGNFIVASVGRTRVRPLPSL